MLAFFIDNQQTEYSKCFSIIRFLRTGEEFHFNSPLILSLFNDYDIKNNNLYDFNLIYNQCSNCTNFLEINSHETLCNILKTFTDVNSFCFFIKNLEENDIIHLHYFELVLRYENNCYLLIESNDKNYFRISDFYQLESQINPFYSHRFFKQTSEKSTKRFAKKNNNSSRRFLPLLRTNATNYSLLSKNILEIFDFSAEELLNLKSNVEKNQKISSETIIQDFCIKLTKEINEYAKKVKTNFSWIRYQDLLSHTSVLGMCYFLSYLHSTVIKKMFNLSSFEITHLLLQSEDFAAGTMQLFENALKHADYGYFCYRIHYAEDKKTYLNNNYNIVYNNTTPFYLELLISDFNENYNIPKKFIQNLKKRSDFKDEIEQINNFGKTLQLRDFFDPSEECKPFWKRYYADKTNVALHYGLNIFEQIVTSSEGKFILFSSNEIQLSVDEIYGRGLINSDKIINIPHIPGTQYKIILPIKNIRIKQKSTGLKVQLDTQQLKQSWEQHTVHFIKTDNSIVQNKSDTNIYFKSFKSHNPQYKESSVIRLYSILNTKLSKLNDHTIVIFDVNEFSSSLQSEVFTKALICLLGKVDLKKIAIINSSHQFMSMFIRVFGLLYYKEITRDFLSDGYIYICGNYNIPSNNHVEIMFNGGNIEEAVYISKQIADYKGEYSSELSVLENIARKCEKSKRKKRVIKIFPFDVLIKTNHQTLFQEKTTYDLNQDLQLYHFGCRLSNVHMKVGSKIHITTDFFESTLLFGIENYISRFAYLLAKKISNELQEKNIKKNVVLIGYETYSETLMIETKNLLHKLFGIKVDYLTYEDSAKEEKFRGVKKQIKFCSATSKYIIIVPIGSTLTTHDKISAELKREFQLQSSDNIIANLCVVLVRDIATDYNLTNTEKVFWSSIKNDYVTLKNEYDIGNDNKVEYVVSVNSKWEKPDSCKCCFPEELSEEKPVLKVNKASVIPMIMMGIKESKENAFKNNYTEIPHGDISKLKNHLKYGHFLRDDNHFEYYFNTETLASDISNQKEFNDWLKSIKKVLKKSNKRNDILQYDFVVAPQHPTNAEFVMQVNNKVFDNPASVIFLDVKKEYRDNVKTKFSNLTQLYNNLCSYGRNAVINFHYVDDTITTGETFNRTKSLIRSLFPEHLVQNTFNDYVKVNIFSSVILLLGRCSSDTKRNYAPIGRFFDYFELNISAMRNYKDACILCKKHSDYEEMRKLSATNSMESVFSSQTKKYQEIKYTEEVIAIFNDGYEKMIITHILNNRLSKLGHNKNNDNYVRCVVSQLIKDIFNENLINNSSMNCTDFLCVLINVISSPFVAFRKSVLSVAFELLLKIANFLLFENNRNSDSYLINELKKHIICLENNQDKNRLENLIKTVFTGLSHLGANFVMRVKTINSFFMYIKNHALVESNNMLCKKWILFYAQIVNQSLMLNRQDSRVLWLEKILKYNVEEGGDTKLEKEPNIEMLKQILLLENTLILSDTLDEAVYAIQNKIMDIKDSIVEEIRAETYQEKNTPFFHNQLNDFYKISEKTNTDLLLKVLFDNNGKLKNQDYFTNALEKTIQAYFCETFRIFSKINNNSLQIEQLLNMSILYLLLLPNSSLSGAREEHLKFYDILVKQIKLVLKVKKVQLFMVQGETIDFICSSDSNNIDCDSQYNEYLQKIIGIDNSISIGETYYLSLDDKCLNAIKIVNNSSDKKYGPYENESKTAWYLVFEVDKKFSTQALLTNARNLLVMRENLLLRLKKDYDNNLYAEFSELRKKVKKLTDDKAGGHTPFAELSEDFDYLYKLSIEASKSNNETIANNMKLITDLLISKLYVCHINEESYPKQIETRKNDIQYNCLRNYKDIILCANDLVLRKDNSLTIKPNISFEGVDWDIEFSFMKKSTFIWISIFYALIMNSLRHGEAETINGNKFKCTVNIKVETTNDHLIISNRYVPHLNANKKGGITLETVKAFFSHFDYNFEIIPEIENNYIVKIPLIKE